MMTTTRYERIRVPVFHLPRGLGPNSMEKGGVRVGVRTVI